VAHIPLSWAEHERRLTALIQTDLTGLAGSVFGLERAQAADILAGQTVAVVPDTSGEGRIEGFTEALVFIARRLGAEAFATIPDLAGFKEAKERRATIALTSDDRYFLAMRLSDGFKSENGWATGVGFAQCLSLMTSGRLAGRPVLTVGAGPVGQAGAAWLRRLGAKPIIADLSPALAARAAGLVGGRVWRPQDGVQPGGFELIFEASTSGRLWPPESLKPGTKVAAPGMPPSFEPSEHYALWHDPLQTGTAVMILQAALGRTSATLTAQPPRFPVQLWS
jgi:pyrrolysine biosynthesis protein PylD